MPLSTKKFGEIYTWLDSRFSDKADEEIILLPGNYPGSVPEGLVNGLMRELVRIESAEPEEGMAWLYWKVEKELTERGIPLKPRRLDVGGVTCTVFMSEGLDDCFIAVRGYCPSAARSLLAELGDRVSVSDLLRMRRER